MAVAQPAATDLGRELHRDRRPDASRHADAAAEAAGHEAIIVSHQLPIWMARCDVEGRRLVHDPRERECALASVTAFTLIEGRVTSVGYSEPAAALIAGQGQQEVRRRCLRPPRQSGSARVVGSARPIDRAEPTNPSRSSRVSWRSVVAPLVMLAVVLLAGCSATGADEPTRAGNQAGYVGAEKSVTIIPPDERKPAPDITGAVLGQDGKDDLDRRPDRQGRGAQRLGLVVPAVPGGGTGPAEGRRADRGGGPVHRAQHPGLRPGAGRWRSSGPTRSPTRASATRPARCSSRLAGDLPPERDPVHPDDRQAGQGRGPGASARSPRRRWWT